MWLVAELENCTRLEFWNKEKVILIFQNDETIEELEQRKFVLNRNLKPTQELLLQLGVKIP